jgi:hypothetical protein
MFALDLIAGGKQKARPSPVHLSKLLSYKKGMCTMAYPSNAVLSIRVSSNERVLLARPD